jgi:hypothetical protein
MSWWESFMSPFHQEKQIPASKLLYYQPARERRKFKTAMELM